MNILSARWHNVGLLYSYKPIRGSKDGKVGKGSRDFNPDRAIMGPSVAMVVRLAYVAIRCRSHRRGFLDCAFVALSLFDARLVTYKFLTGKENFVNESGDVTSCRLSVQNRRMVRPISYTMNANRNTLLCAVILSNGRYHLTYLQITSDSFISSI